MKSKWLPMDDYYRQFEEAGFVREAFPGGFRYTLQPPYGEGGFEIWGDIDTCIACFTDVVYNRPFVVREALAEKYIEFGQFTMGEVAFYQKRSEVYPIDYGLNYWVNWPHLAGYKRMEPGMRLVSHGVMYRERFFEELPFPLPGDFWETAARVLNPEAVDLPAVTAICEQMRSCRLTGTALEMYVRGKGLEALALTLEYVYAKEKPPGLCLSGRDRAVLEQVAGILEREMRAPPPIGELARCVGLGQQKMMRGFKQLYGVTVYGYLRRLRMEKASRMLAETDMPVAAVAREVGYHGDGHFQQAFRQAYGLPPARFRREMWGTGG